MTLIPKPYVKKKRKESYYTKNYVDALEYAIKCRNKTKVGENALDFLYSYACEIHSETVKKENDFTED